MIVTMNQDILIRNSEFNIGKVDNSTINTQNSTLRTAHNTTSAQPTTQHSTLPKALINDSLTMINVPPNQHQ